MRTSVAIAWMMAALLVRAGTAPATDCAGAIATTRLRIDTSCSCDVAPSHGAYVRCAAGIAKAYVAAGILPRECRGAVMRCVARSTCGRPGAVTCCRASTNGTSRCNVERDASRCRAPRSGTASIGTGSCCDTCMAISTTSTTTGSSSTTTPAGFCGNGVLDPGETCDLPAFDPRCAEAPPILGVQCIPPGEANECLCCPTACIIPGGGCCPGLTCVERPGQVGQVRLGDCLEDGGSPDGAFDVPDLRQQPAGSSVDQPGTLLRRGQDTLRPAGTTTLGR